MIINKRKIWNLHAHSQFSAQDALPEVKDMVATVKSYGHPALGLTDHGNMAGSVQLYKNCMEAGIKPFPGTELYVVHNREDKKAKRHHMCVVAYTTQGYVNLVNLNNLANTNFYNKPLIDHSDMAELSEAGLLKGIAATSGCYFGYIAQAIDNDDRMSAMLFMQGYQTWFDKFYVELQNHNITHDNGMTDDSLADQLMDCANNLGIPCILTQDSHYCHQDEKPVHETMKRLVSFGPDADDAVFPGDGFHLGDSEWFATHHHKARYDCGADGLEDLLSAHTLEIPELDNYKYNIPFTVEDPDKELGRLCVTEYGERNLSDRYLERLEDELQIVRDTGMAGYLLLVAQVTDWCRANRVFYQARGSASGSILCWLLKITQVDPLKHRLRFERFISRDRTRPPDIDLDVEFKRRQELIEWLESRFSVHQIGTWLQLSLHGDDESSKGSIRVKYYAKARGAGNPIHEWKDVPPEDKRELYALGDSSAYSAYGVHPAGLVVTTNDAQFNKLVPMMKVASSKTYVTQYGMNDVEALGLVKLDILGLKTLSILHQCMDNLGRDVFDGLDWIPNSDPAVYRMIAKGETDGVFQLEGWAAKTGCMSLQPTKLGDVIASMALFRPATMQSGATESYIRRKHKEERIPIRHTLIDSHTKETYGIMLYQEQVIAILRDLGMDPDNLTKFLKAVKASNSSVGDASGVIAGYESRLKSLADSHGMSEADWKWLWTAIEGFAAYGFNKAHATAYGLTAYRCAYLAHHHPVQFFAAVLAIHAGTEKEKQYVKAARYKGLSIRRPDVNKSGVTYAVDPRGKAIRKGLVAIKGLGVKSAELIVDKRPEGGYTSIEDMCRTVGSRVSGAKAFIETGSTDVGVIGKLKEEKAFVSLDDEEETI